jgi:hypothetical protein
MAMARYRSDDGGSTDFRNVGRLVPVYTALQPRRQPSSYVTTVIVNASSLSIFTLKVSSIH